MTPKFKTQKTLERSILNRLARHGSMNAFEIFETYRGRAPEGGSVMGAILTLSRLGKIEEQNVARWYQHRRMEYVAIGSK